MRIECVYSRPVNKSQKKKPRSRNVVTVNLTCPVLLYESGKLEWQKRGFTGPSDVFQSALRKMAGLDVSL